MIMSAQNTEKRKMCMNTHEEYEKMAVMIDSGASETAVSVEKFESSPIEKTTASGTTYASSAGKQAENIVNVGQRYIRVVDNHATWRTKFQMCSGLGQDKLLEAPAGWWKLDNRWCSDTQGRIVTLKKQRPASKRVFLPLFMCAGEPRSK